MRLSTIDFMISTSLSVSLFSVNCLSRVLRKVAKASSKLGTRAELEFLPTMSSLLTKCPVHGELVTLSKAD